MARFFVDALPGAGTEYELTGENAEHARVLRLRPGETVPAPTEPRAAVSVWIAFPKADKAEHVIQKATELGAAEIVLFPTRFCVSRPDAKSLGKKLERWQKIARSAAEQSRRGRIPEVRAVDSYEAALQEAATADLPVLFYENEHARTLRAALDDSRAIGSEGAVRICLMTGAEGGFSEEEISRAEAAGMRICTLGPRILRCETAPLAGLAAVMYALGEL